MGQCLLLSRKMRPPGQYQEPQAHERKRKNSGNPFMHREVVVVCAPEAVNTVVLVGFFGRFFLVFVLLSQRVLFSFSLLSLALQPQGKCVIKKWSLVDRL